MASPLTQQAAVLQALLGRGHAFGLEIIARVAELTNDKIILQQGTLYPLLRSMEEKGLLHSQEGEPISERGGRPRRYYELTPLGEKVAQEERQVIINFLCLKLAAERRLFSLKVTILRHVSATIAVLRSAPQSPP